MFFLWNRGLEFRQGDESMLITLFLYCNLRINKSIRYRWSIRHIFSYQGALAFFISASQRDHINSLGSKSARACRYTVRLSQCSIGTAVCGFFICRFVFAKKASLYIECWVTPTFALYVGTSSHVIRWINTQGSDKRQCLQFKVFSPHFSTWPKDEWATETITSIAT